MDGLIFKCKKENLKHCELFSYAVHMMYSAARKLKMELNHNPQVMIDAYIDFVLQDEQAYIESLKKSKDLEDKTELDILLQSKEIMDLKYWKNYSHITAIFNEGFRVGNIKTNAILN